MKPIYAFLSVIALVALSAIPVAAEPPGTIEGLIVNRTRGGGPVSGLEVLLLRGGPEREAELRTISDSTGAFRFPVVAGTGPLTYSVSVNYSGVDYASPPIPSPAGQTSQIEIPVFETTEDGSAIQAGLGHVIIEVDRASQVLVVTEVLVFPNDGDRTYIGSPTPGAGKRETLKLPLPAGAFHVEPVEGVEPVDPAGLAKGQGLGDTVPFQPGQRQMAYSYVLEYTDRAYTYQRPVAYSTGRINLLISDVGARVTAPGFNQQQPVEIQGNKYLVLSGGGLASGEVMEVQFDGLPVGGGQTTSTTDNLKLAAIGLPVAGIALALGFFVLRRRRAPARVALEVRPVTEERALLLESLADLDGRFEAGDIQDSEYHRLRAELKTRLAALW